MDLQSRARWLKLAGGITVVFGALMAVAAVPALQAPMVLLLDLVFLPLDGAESLASPTARLLTGITGGLMVGYGVLVWLLAAELLLERPDLVRRFVLVAIGSWFVVDSSMSFLVGAYVNVLLNVLFLLMFYVPVWGLGQSAGELSTA